MNIEASRRSFLKGAGIATGAVAATALVGTAVADENEYAYDCDVVIAGAGIGGLAAAVASVETGAKTILVEASAHVGGTSRFAAGALGPRFGYEWADTYAQVPLSDPDLGHAVLDNWNDTVDWIKSLGCVVEELSGAYLWMGGRRPKEQGSKSYTDEYLQHFGQTFIDKGGVTLTSTRATDIILDDDNKPCGLECLDADGNFFKIAAKSVIIATGGFQCNKEMVTRYLGRHADVSQAQCIPYLDGAGIQMAERAGAKLSKSFGSFYGHPQPWPQDNYCLYDTPEAYEAADVDDVHKAYYGCTLHPVAGQGILVNCEGKRFVNEGLTSSLVNQEIMQQFYNRAYLFLDEAAYETIQSIPFFNCGIAGGDRLTWLKEHGAHIFEADTLEELADKIVNESVSGDKFNAKGFLKTAAEWNAAVENETTEDLDFPVSSGNPLTTPPFYCIPLVSGIMATFGGIKIDVNSQAIGKDDKPMPGLWAVPGAAGGIMEGDYWCVMSGYTVFGRIAGINAAKAALA